MIKKESEINSSKIENNTSEVETSKNLCVHELKKRLRNQQRKESIIKVIVFFTLIILIGIISLFFY